MIPEVNGRGPAGQAFYKLPHAGIPCVRQRTLETKAIDYLCAAACSVPGGAASSAALLPGGARGLVPRRQAGDQLVGVA